MNQPFGCDMLSRMTADEVLALIRTEAAKRGWKDNKLAAESDVHATTLSKILGGTQDPRLSSLLRLFNALGLTVVSVQQGYSGEQQRPKGTVEPPQPQESTEPQGRDVGTGTTLPHDDDHRFYERLANACADAALAAPAGSARQRQFMELAVGFEAAADQTVGRAAVQRTISEKLADIDAKLREG